MNHPTPFPGVLLGGWSDFCPALFALSQLHCLVLGLRTAGLGGVEGCLNNQGVGMHFFDWYVRGSLGNHWFCFSSFIYFPFSSFSFPFGVFPWLLCMQFSFQSFNLQCRTGMFWWMTGYFRGKIWHNFCASLRKPMPKLGLPEPPHAHELQLRSVKHSSNLRM